MSTSVVVAGFVRSPFTPAGKGQLARIRPDDVAAQVVAALVGRCGLDPCAIEDLIVGCAFPEAEQGLNVARTIGLLAGLPATAAAATVNRLCGSSMQAVHMAAGAVAMGAGDAIICAGVESMTRVPMPGFNPLPHPGLSQSMPGTAMAMGETAELLAKTCGVGRKEQDGFAAASHRRAAAAVAAGRFAEELVAIRDRGRLIDWDGCIRSETREATLADLPPAFAAAGSVTAGNTSPLSDGAAALLVCSEDFAERAALKPLARLRAVAVAGCAPELMGLGPIAATHKALARAGLQMSDIDVVELNEAFAVQAIACMRELGIDPDRVNVDGGAIALGHPLGATGIRIVGKAAAILARTGGEFALATQCIGGGQGIATILESL